ncbi:serine/threonine-protein kinase HAL4/sat4 [Mortierella sp. AD094]|nr:serine/threonine-protein kinase HAL4/sat4 [Mortierella sp. AD094]
MVTFSTDYWAPAMEVNVRRRQEKSLFHTQKEKQHTSQDEHWNTLRQVPTTDSTTSTGHLSTMGSNTESQNAFKKVLFPKPPPVAITNKKQTLMHKIFHHESKSASPSPPSSPIFTHTPIEQDPHLLNTSTPLEKKNIFNFANVLGRTASSFGSERSDSKKADCTLLKKYGLCDKGNIGQGATAVVRLAHKLSEEDDSEKLFAEYCCGGDLYNSIKQGHMSRVEIDCCFKQLINGVAYLHSMGVAHRDIKPENLLLDGQGRLKITDFGVSDVFRMCWEKSPHLSKGLCGSEPYIAPEEFMNKEYDARRVDIWACGIVYYCMVYQGIPFRAATAQDPNYQHFLDMRAVNNYEPIEKLPFGARNLMKRILDPNPETRITIEGILEDEWFKNVETCIHGENLDPHRHFERSL